MNPYLYSMLADDRLARFTPGTWRGGRRAECSLGTTDTVLLPGSAGRLRRTAGWLLVEAGLRLAFGRRPAALRG